ncbi:MAG: hypothetical protein IKD72_04085 [Clostridia bacterium]|nr:hypothetical protein [Clostridia bacterium]
MKRRFLILLSVLLLCGLTACGTAQPTLPASDPDGQTTAAAANAVEFARAVRISRTAHTGAAPQVLAADSPAAYAQAIAQLQLPPETTESADWQAFAGAADALLDAAFFEKSAVLLVLTEEGCSQSEYETAEYENGALTLLRKNFDPADDGLQDWLTLVALPKDKAPADAADVTVLVRDLDPVPTTKNPIPPAERTTTKPMPKTMPALETPDVTFAEEPTAAARQPADLSPRFIRIYPQEYVSFVQPPVTILRSRAELVRFYEVNRESLGLGSKSPNAVNPAYGMTQPADGTAGFADWMSYYDDAFFAVNALILVQTTESSGSHRYREAQFVNGKVIITAERPEVGTCDMASWITLLPVPQAALAGVRDEAVTVEKQIVNC